MQIQDAQASLSATPVHCDHVTNQCKRRYLTPATESSEFESLMKPTPKRHVIVLEIVIPLSLLDKGLASFGGLWIAPVVIPRLLYSC